MQVGAGCVSRHSPSNQHYCLELPALPARLSSSPRRHGMPHGRAGLPVSDLCPTSLPDELGCNAAIHTRSRPILKAVYHQNKYDLVEYMGV